MLRKEDFLNLHEEDMEKKIVGGKIRKLFSIQLEDRQTLYMSYPFSEAGWKRFKKVAKGLRVKDLICK